MARLSADVRLRPIRFAFLVRPDDKARVLEICRVNTCLWGGRFNPIIPRLKTVPQWWDRHSHSFETARQIVNGYLDFFEPDFLVEAEPGLADGLEFDPKRVLALGSLLRRSDQNFMDGHGQSVFDLYRELYQKEFQFTRRHPHSIIDVNAEDRSLVAAAACLFGAFPEEPVFSYFKEAFVDVFEPRQVSFTGATLLDSYQSRIRPEFCGNKFLGVTLPLSG